MVELDAEPLITFSAPPHILLTQAAAPEVNVVLIKSVAHANMKKSVAHPYCVREDPLPEIANPGSLPNFSKILFSKL